MKIRFWGLVAFDIAAMCVIARIGSLALTMVLVMSLLMANILLAFAFRRSPSPRVDPSGRIATLPHWVNWTDYIPLLGGTVCVFIGVLELTWEPCLIGGVAIAVGLLRVWSKGRV
jgi:hypothetical protein